jgi:four helix bundle protein
MPQNFRTYQLALQLHPACKQVRLPYYLKDQLLRAASSVALNLAEGSAKSSPLERRRFYIIALGSLREVQALIRLEPEALGHLHELADSLGAHLYRLTRATPGP